MAEKLFPKISKGDVITLAYFSKRYNRRFTRLVPVRRTTRKHIVVELTFFDLKNKNAAVVDVKFNRADGLYSEVNEMDNDYKMFVLPVITDDVDKVKKSSRIFYLNVFKDIMIDDIRKNLQNMSIETLIKVEMLIDNDERYKSSKWFMKIIDISKRWVI